MEDSQPRGPWSNDGGMLDISIFARYGGPCSTFTSSSSSTAKFVDHFKCSLRVTYRYKLHVSHLFSPSFFLLGQTCSLVTSTSTARASATYTDTLARALQSRTAFVTALICGNFTNTNSSAEAGIATRLLQFLHVTQYGRSLSGQLEKGRGCRRTA
jgi:hypothetical protein